MEKQNKPENGFMIYINSPLDFIFNKKEKPKNIIEKWKTQFVKATKYVIDVIDGETFVYSPVYSLVPILIPQIETKKMNEIQLMYEKNAKTVYAIMTPKIIILCDADWKKSELCAKIVSFANTDGNPCFLVKDFLNGVDKRITYDGITDGFTNFSPSPAE